MKRITSMDEVNIGDLLMWVTKEDIKKKSAVCGIIKNFKIQQDIYDGEWIETKKLITEQTYRMYTSKTFNPKIKDGVNVFRLSDIQKEKYKLMIMAEEL